MSQALEPNALVINPALGFELSPYLYMQFMEPLGPPTDLSKLRGIDLPARARARVSRRACV